MIKPIDKIADRRSDPQGTSAAQDSRRAKWARTSIPLIADPCF